MKSYLKTLAAVFAAVFVITDMQKISSAVSQALSRCINIIIPSLFIMMIISRILTDLKVPKFIKRIFKPVEYITGLNGELLPVFLMSNIGGFPIGASMTAQLVGKGVISEKQAPVVASYCFSSGPAFLIGAVGLCTYGSKKAGTAMLIACVLANLAASIVYNRLFKIRINRCSSAPEKSINITELIADSGKALFKMCAVIVAFSAVGVMCDRCVKLLGLSDKISDIIMAVIEITNLEQLGTYGSSLISVSTALVSFGGLCVWLQNAALVNKRFSIIEALLLRIPVSLLSGLIFKLLFPAFLEDSMPVNANISELAVNIDNFLPSICLIIMIFLTIDKKRFAFSKEV